MTKQIILYFIITLTLLLAACGGDDNDVNNNEGINDTTETNEANNNNNTEEENDEATEDNQSQESLEIGDSTEFEGLTITLNEARVEPGGDFDSPENDKFVVVNLTAENTSDEEVTISSMLNVELYDEEGYSYSTTILTEGIQGQFDGTVAPGKKLRGEIPFDVPDSNQYELNYNDPFGSDRAVWIIDQSDLE